MLSSSPPPISSSSLVSSSLSIPSVTSIFSCPSLTVASGLWLPLISTAAKINHRKTISPDDNMKSGQLTKRSRTHIKCVKEFQKNMYHSFRFIFEVQKLMLLGQISGRVRKKPSHDLCHKSYIAHQGYRMPLPHPKSIKLKPTGQHKINTTTSPTSCATVDDIEARSKERQILSMLKMVDFKLK